jgi:hypothetical protein
MPTMRNNMKPKPNENDRELAVATEDDACVDSLSEAAVILGSSYIPEDVAPCTLGQTYLPLPPLLDGQGGPKLIP